MSSSYKLLYQDRRQFVFEEFQETHTTAIVTLVAGFIAGSLLGIYFASLDATTAGSILLAIVTYITIMTSIFSLKTSPLSVLLIFVTSLSAVLLLIYMSRVVLGYFSESPMKLILVFAGSFAIVAELVYLWSRITWVEDSRMHQLIDAERDDKKSPSSSTHHHHSREINLLSFFWFVWEVFLFGFLRLFYNLKGDKTKAARYPFLFVESLSKWPLSAKMKPIIIKNESPKKVKVCVYHRSDFCCWIPVGGLTGGVYDLERGDELCFSPHWPDTSFRVKIFAHGMIDFELASNPHVVRGRMYSFIDVGKPITMLFLASSPPSTRNRHSYPLSSSDEENSDDELMTVAHKPSFGSSVGGLKRVASSRANLSALLASSPNSPRSNAGDYSNEQIILTPTSVRKTLKMLLVSPERIMSKSIAVLNESTSDVRVLFYNNEDISFVIALDEFQVTDTSMMEDKESGLVKRNAWKIFDYTGSKPKEKFCMRVRTSLAQTTANMELSYCTALLGDALVIRDPIVSPT
jgi:hypothetical protein